MKKTTAISRYNAAATYGSGKVGNIRFYRKGQRTYVRSAYNSAITNPRTENQMKRRLKFASVSNCWNVLKPYLQKSFEGTTPSVSTANLFMKANKANGLYLDKEMNYKKMAKAMPLVVSAGRLPNINVDIITDGGDTYIKTSILVSADPMSKVADLAQQIIANNRNFEEGDQITLLQILEEVAAGSIYPRISASAPLVILDTNDETPLTDIEIQFAKDSDNMLLIKGFPMTEKAAVAAIHSKKIDGGLMVSDASTLLTPSCDYTAYLTDEALKSAMASYGTSETVYLDPTSHIDDNNQPTPPPTATHTVTLAVAQGQQSMGSVSGAGTYNHGAAVSIKAIPAVGYRFVKWSDNNTQAERTLFVTQDVNLVATFESTTPSTTVNVTINYTGDGEGKATGDGQYQVGDSVKLTAEPGEGSDFAGWKIGGITHNENPYEFNITQDTTVECEFAGSF